jgi:hypothetical protein
MIESLFARYRDRGPVTLARLHHTAAEVALITGDAIAFERHAEAMGLAARSTNSASLIAQWKRLRRRGAPASRETAAAREGIAHLVSSAALAKAPEEATLIDEPMSEPDVHDPRMRGVAMSVRSRRNSIASP